MILTISSSRFPDRIHRQCCYVINVNPFWTLASGVAQQQLVAFHFEGEIGGGQLGFRCKLEGEGGLAHAGASADEVECAGPVDTGQPFQHLFFLFVVFHNRNFCAKIVPARIL